MTDNTFNLPYCDDLEDYTLQTDFGTIDGQLMINYDEATYTSGDETFIKSVEGAEVYGFHVGGNVVLPRGQLLRIVGRATVEEIETQFFERRKELI